MLPSEQISRTAVADQVTPAGRDLLLRRQEGRLAYTSGRGPQTVVVSYTIHDGHLVIRVPEYNEIAWYAPGTEVTFTVDGDHADSGAVQLRRMATTGRCHEQASALDPRAEHWPEGVHVTVICLRLAVSEIPGKHFDLVKFSRAIDAGDIDGQIAAYAESAEVEVIDADNPPSSPHVLRGKNAIAEWLRSSCQRHVAQRLVRIIDGDDRIAYTVTRVRCDGSHEIATSTAELRDGMVTHQHTILVRDSVDGHARLPRAHVSETQRAMAG
jgi:hypothetical protein